MPVEKTVVLIKPHAVAAGWAKNIMRKYDERNFKLWNSKTVRLTEEQAAAFYAKHKGKPFYDGLIKSMTEGPLLAIVYSGENVIQQVRDLNGKTNPDDAAPGTIRHDFKGPGGPYNTVHGSDSVEAAEREISIVFS